MLIKMRIVSDDTHAKWYQFETEALDILEAAYKYGRCGSGEVIAFYDESKETLLGRAAWDRQYRKYLAFEGDEVERHKVISQKKR